jgi:hypothetical protein
MEKLVKIQNELKAPKNQFNSFGKYKYRSCEDILEALKPLLLKYNCSLVINDEIKEIGSILFVEATAVFFDNENAKEIKIKAQAGIDPNKKGMDISQCFGSSSSYARKYALNGLFLIDDTKDADATNTHDKKPLETKAKPKTNQTESDSLQILSNENIDYAIQNGLADKTLKLIGVKYYASKEQKEKLQNAIK